MKPLGRKCYKDKTGGKHKYKENGRTSSWWEDVCEPNKRRFKEDFKQELREYLQNHLSFYEEYGNENEAFWDVRKEISDELNIDINEVEIEWLPVVGEWCIYVKGRWSGYYEPEIEQTDEERENLAEYHKWLEDHLHCDTGTWDCPDPENCPWNKPSTWVW